MEARTSVQAGAINAYAFFHDVAPVKVSVVMVEASPAGVLAWFEVHEGDSLGDGADPEYLEFLEDTGTDPTRRRRAPRSVPATETKTLGYGWLVAVAVAAALW